MKVPRLVAALLGTILLALTLTAQDAPATDDALIDQVRVKLTLDADVNGGALEVAAKDGVVTLRGELRTEKARKKAEKVAGKVKGVKKVVNEIKLSPLGR